MMGVRIPRYGDPVEADRYYEGHARWHWKLNVLRYSLHREDRTRGRFRAWPVAIYRGDGCYAPSVRLGSRCWGLIRVIEPVRS